MEKSWEDNFCEKIHENGCSVCKTHNMTECAERVLFRELLQSEKQKIIDRLEKISYEAYTPAFRKQVVNLEDAIKIIKEGD